MAHVLAALGVHPRPARKVVRKPPAATLLQGLRRLMDP
jgi:hypothetical protein